MPKYAEVNAEGLVTKVFENSGESYTPVKGSFLLQTDRYGEADVGKTRYEPVEGNFPQAFPFLGTLKAKKDASDGKSA